MASRYTSAIERLRALPDIFTGRDLTVRFQWSSETASTYLAQWRKNKLVRSLGGHSDVHMNLVARPQPNPEAALRRALPEAVKIGADVLREAGWTTQIDRQPEVAILTTSPRYLLQDFRLSGRAPRWFATVAPGLIATADGIRHLKPAWALADMILRAMDRRVKDRWLLAPDDIDLQLASGDASTHEAVQAFGLPQSAFTEAGYSAVYDGMDKRDDLERLRRFRGRVPADFKFDRLEANEDK